MTATTTRRRKGKPYHPVHDRKATDLLRNALVAPIEVDDPMGLEPGDRIVVMRSIRNDPLANMHAKGYIDDAQYHGGRAFQRDWEKAERGPRAIDPGKECVDGGVMPEPITDGQKRSVVRLNQVERELGLDGSAIIYDVLVGGLSMAQVGERRGLESARWQDYFSRRLRECLDRLAVFYGFATRRG